MNKNKRGNDSEAFKINLLRANLLTQITFGNFIPAKRTFSRLRLLDEKTAMDGVVAKLSRQLVNQEDSRVDDAIVALDLPPVYVSAIACCAASKKFDSGLPDIARGIIKKYWDHFKRDAESAANALYLLYKKGEAASADLLSRDNYSALVAAKIAIEKERRAAETPLIVGKPIYPLPK